MSKAGATSHGHVLRLLSAVREATQAIAQAPDHAAELALASVLAPTIASPWRAAQGGASMASTCTSWHWSRHALSCAVYLAQRGPAEFLQAAETTRQVVRAGLAAWLALVSHAFDADGGNVAVLDKLGTVWLAEQAVAAGVKLPSECMASLPMCIARCAQLPGVQVLVAAAAARMLQL